MSKHGTGFGARTAFPNEPRQGSQRKHPVTPLLAALGPVLYAAKTRGGHIKIGWTSNLAARQRHHGKISDILAWRTGTPEDEQAIHTELSGLAIKGREYYSPTDRHVLAIVNAWREDMGIPPVISAA